MNRQYVTTKEASEQLGLCRVQILYLIGNGTLPAIRIGRDWLIDPADIPLARQRRKPGRPRKAAATR